MSERDERLGDELERLAASYAGKSDPEAVIDGLRRGSTAPVHERRRGPVLLAAAACLALLVAVGVVVSKDTPTDVAVTPGTAAPAATALTARVGKPVVAVAGVSPNARYVVWGGEEAGTPDVDRVDGFTVDLDTGAVSAIPPAPIGPSFHSLGAWTGRELVVWSAASGPCIACYTGNAAAWVPSSNTWRTIAAPPSDLRSGLQSVVGADGLVVTVTRTGEAASYDVAADRWQRLPKVPQGAYVNESLVWTGSEILFWATTWRFGGATGDDGVPIADRGWRWRPGDDDWTPLPIMPIGHRTSVASAVWTGTELVVWGMASGGAPNRVVGTGAVWNRGTNTWRAMAPSPQPAGDYWEGAPGSECLGADVTAGTVRVWPLEIVGAVNTGMLTYRPDANAWGSTGMSDRDQVMKPCLIAPDGRLLMPDPTAPFRAV